MSICINCNIENSNNNLFCQQCSSELLIEGRYRATQPLGAGGFGVTYEVNDQGSLKVLKVLRHDSPKAIELFQREAKFLASNNHPGIPKAELNSYFKYEPKNSQQCIHCLVMEKIEGINLQEYIKQSGKPITGNLGLQWLKEIVEILDRVHSQDIIHRDIKPHNIMLQPDGKLILIDFGAVTDEGIVEEQTATATSGTQSATHNAGGTRIYSKGYASPEQMQGQAIKQSDIYSLGRTFVYLLTTKDPNDPVMYDVFNDRINWRQYAQEISPKFADLIDSMIQRVPNQRIANTQLILKQINQLNSNQHQASSQIIPEEDIEVKLNITQPEANSGTSKFVSFSRYIYINGIRQSESKTLTVQVPTGSQNGTRLRLQGQGNQGLNGANSSNVYVTILVAKSVVTNEQKQQIQVKSLLPLLVVGGFIGVAVIYSTGFFSMLVGNLSSPTNTNINQNQNQSCSVNINGNIRSEPSSQAGNATVISMNTNNLSLTGIKTQGGWNQVKSTDGNIGWVHNSIVANSIPTECIKQTVNDADYITSKPTPTPTKAATSSNPNQCSEVQIWVEEEQKCVDDVEKMKKVQCEKDGGTWNGLCNQDEFSQEAAYQKGFAAGTAKGNEHGQEDGSFNGGQGAMHIQASCTDVTGSDEYVKGFTEACEAAYRKAFAAARSNTSQ